MGVPSPGPRQRLSGVRSNHPRTHTERFVSDEGYVLVRLDPDDLLLESIRELCESSGIHTGVLVSGIGTLKRPNLHYVHTAAFPPDREDLNTTLELDGAWEVTNFGGIIADGEPHRHVTAFDGDRTAGGHLEEGSVVHVLAELTIRSLPDLELTRRPGETGILQLRRASVLLPTEEWYGRSYRCTGASRPRPGRTGKRVRPAL